MSFLEVRKVTKTYPSRSEDVTPLKELDLDVAQGEFVALMGPSGSGKTTLLNLIAGIDQPTSGTVRVGADEISSMSVRALAHWRTRHVGFVFQQYNLIPVLSAAENVEVPLLLLPLSRAERRAKVATALEAVGLSDRATATRCCCPPERARGWWCARALVAGPDLVLADEPTGNLDETAAEAILALLSTLHRRFGQTFVMVTHDPRAAATAERIVRLDKGRIHADERRVTSAGSAS